MTFLSTQVAWRAPNPNPNPNPSFSLSSALFSSFLSTPSLSNDRRFSSLIAAETFLSGDERGETSAVRRLPQPQPHPRPNLLRKLDPAFFVLSYGLVTQRSRHIVTIKNGRLFTYLKDTLPSLNLQRMKNEPARRRLARIRCLLESIKRIEQGKSLPLPLCFVSSEVEYGREESRNPSTLTIRKKPHKDAQCVGELPSASNLQVFASGDEFFNNDGSWIKLCQVWEWLLAYIIMYPAPELIKKLNTLFSQTA